MNLSTLASVVQAVVATTVVFGLGALFGYLRGISYDVEGYLASYIVGGVLYLILIAITIYRVLV